MSDEFKTFVGFQEKPKEIRLTVELVPASSWGDNLRLRLKKSEWDRLRRAQYSKAANLCEICGGSGFGQGFRFAVECHEVWEYDDALLIQTLKGLIALCPMCHKVKHFGLTEKRGEGHRAIHHLMKVNGWTQFDAVAHVRQAADVWRTRSEHPWRLNLDWLKSMGVQADTPAGLEVPPRE